MNEMNCGIFKYKYLKGNIIAKHQWQDKYLRASELEQHGKTDKWNCDVFVSWIPPAYLYTFPRCMYLQKYLHKSCKKYSCNYYPSLQCVTVQLAWKPPKIHRMHHGSNPSLESVAMTKRPAMTNLRHGTQYAAVTWCLCLWCSLQLPSWPWVWC